MGHGNDGGGSIRIPAAWCGLVGLKPSRGRVPIGPAVGEAVSGFAHEFALTRTVRDAAALLDAVSGPDPGDRYYISSPQQPFASSLGTPPAPLRVAACTTSPFGTPVEPHVRSAVEEVLAVLEQMGHHVEEACPAGPRAAAARLPGDDLVAGPRRPFVGLRAHPRRRGGRGVGRSGLLGLHPPRARAERAGARRGRCHGQLRLAAVGRLPRGSRPVRVPDDALRCAALRDPRPGRRPLRDRLGLDRGRVRAESRSPR